MGLTSSNLVSKTFLSIGYGKLRQKSVNGAKVDEHTPKAMYRSMPDKPDKGSWAIEHDALAGKIVNIFYKESKDFGNSYDVTFSDGGELYQVTFKEDYMGFNFLKKLPNINFSLDCELKCFPDFTTKDGKKVMAGISLIQNGVKIPSAYEAFDEASKTWKYLLGFPVPETDMNWKDKDDRDMLNARIRKFFKAEFSTKWKPLFEAAQPPVSVEPIEQFAPTDLVTTDELPF